MRQKIFNFDFKDPNDVKNFYINDTNIDAFNGINNKNSNSIFLVGPQKCGKSFLSNIWIKKNNAIIYKNNFDELINQTSNIFIDNINEKKNEEELFHILNHCKLFNLKILITSSLNINEIPFTLNDLISRLKIFTVLKINKPDDDMLINLLTKQFMEKQFIINSHDIFHFILKNANRSYKDVYDIVNKLDSLSIEKKRQLTIPLIKEII